MPSTSLVSHNCPRTARRKPRSRVPPHPSAFAPRESSSCSTRLASFVAAPASQSSGRKTLTTGEKKMRLMGRASTMYALQP